MSRRSESRRAQRRAKQSRKWGATKNARPGRETRPGVEMGEEPEYSESRSREGANPTRD
jgi:hypothetical protein